MQTSHKSLYIFVFVLIAASLLPLWAAYLHHVQLNDDAYITLVYVKNLVSGRGFVYNFPPATSGTTTPLLTVIIAVLASVIPQIEMPTIAVFFTVFCYIGIAWIFWGFRNVWDIPTWQACILGLVVIVSTQVVFFGMEAYLFAFFLVLSLSLFYAERFFWAGITMGLLFLTRGEGALIPVICVSLYILQHWIKPFRLSINDMKPILYLGLGFLLSTVPWFIYAFITFGEILPNTLSTAQAFGQLPQGRLLIQRLFEDWLPLWGRQFSIGGNPYLSLWWVLILVGIGSTLWHRRKWLIFLAWISLYIGGYALLRVSAAWWYQVPIYFVALVFFALGLIQIIEWVLQYKTNVFSVVLSTAIAVAIIFILAGPTIRSIRNYSGDPRAESYLELSQWIRENTQPSESIAYVEVGYIGYFTANPIIDLIGKVLPDVVPYVAQGDFSWGFWHHQPDYFIYLPDFDWALADIKNDERFAQQYQPVATLAGPREADITIYQRKNIDQ